MEILTNKTEFDCEICGERKAKAEFFVNEDYGRICVECARLPKRTRESFIELRHLCGTPFSELNEEDQILALSNKRNRDPRMAALAREIACGDIPYEEHERQKAGLELGYIDLTVDTLEIDEQPPKRLFAHFHCDAEGVLSYTGAVREECRMIPEAAVRRIFGWAIAYLDIPFWGHDLTRIAPELESEIRKEGLCTNWRLKFSDARGVVTETAGRSSYSPGPVDLLEFCLRRYCFERKQ